MKRALLCLAFCACAAIPAAAQDSMETVAVTGYRSSDSGSTQPYVVLTRRADHLYTSITVENDTRDPIIRLSELRATLRAVLAAARAEPRITLSVQKNEVLKDFTEELIEAYITPGGRPDTSRATILVKTQISADDSFDSATGRIEAFIRSVPRNGRSEITKDTDWELAVVGPQQYHGAVIARIAANAKESAAMFGPDYGVHIEGLHQPLLWYRSGQLDLALYIPYTMVVEPK